MIVQAPTGATAVSVAYFPDDARTGTPVTIAATPVSAGWSVDDTHLPSARYWPRVSAVLPSGTQVLDLASVDLQPDDRLLVTPEALAVSAGVPLPLSDSDREVIVEAILDAQSDVEAYLGRPVMPQEYAARGVWDYGDSWDLSGYTDEDVVRIISATPEMEYGSPSGTFTVTYLAGIDARQETYRPIRRYVMAHARSGGAFGDVWKRTTKAKGDIKSISAEGQSVSFTAPSLGGGGAAGSGAPGSLPGLNTIDRWRIAGRRVHQGPTQYGRRYS